MVVNGSLMKSDRIFLLFSVWNGILLALSLSSHSLDDDGVMMMMIAVCGFLCVVIGAD